MLDELIDRLRAGELTLDEFATAAAAAFVTRTAPEYPETDGDVALVTGVSSATIQVAVLDGDLTEEEANAIYDALPETGD